jgi:hypothetical protein
MQSDPNSYLLRGEGKIFLLTSLSIGFSLRYWLKLFLQMATALAAPILALELKRLLRAQSSGAVPPLLMRERAGVSFS